jgi:hypothetical protein
MVFCSFLVVLLENFMKLVEPMNTRAQKLRGREMLQGNIELRSSEVGHFSKPILITNFGQELAHTAQIAILLTRWRKLTRKRCRKESQNTKCFLSASLHAGNTLIDRHNSNVDTVISRF